LIQFLFDVINDNENELNDIDINDLDFNKLPSDIKNKWRYSNIYDENENENEFNKYNTLFKIIVIHCNKSPSCKEQFMDNNKFNRKDILFNIISFKDNDDNGNSITNNAFIINNEIKQAIHAFTLNEIDNNKYEINDKYPSNQMSYSLMNLLNINGNLINNNFEYDAQYIIKAGIELLAECEIKLQFLDGTILNPEDYNLSINDVEEDTIIEDKYGVKLDSKFTLNVVDAKILFVKLAETKNNIIYSETYI